VIRVALTANWRTADVTAPLLWSTVTVPGVPSKTAKPFASHDELVPPVTFVRPD